MRPFTLPRYVSSPLRLALALLLALTFTLLSSAIERKGPELASYGNLCGPNSDQDCLEPILNAGFPFAYLFDVPGVSVERKLFIVQDTIRPIPFALSFLVYLALPGIISVAVRRIKNAISKPPPFRSDA